MGLSGLLLVIVVACVVRAVTGKSEDRTPADFVGVSVIATILYLLLAGLAAVLS